MNWINIPTTFLRSPEFIGAEPTERATWLSLLGYCCEQENGGRLAGCREWKDRRWQQTCGVTADEVAADSELWSWIGDDLVLFAYPADKEEIVRKKREGGRTGGKRSGEARRKDSIEAPIEAPSEAPAEPPAKESFKESFKESLNGKERKGKEEKGKESPTDSCPQADEKAFLESLWEALPAKSRNRSTKAKLAKEWKKTKWKPREDAVLDAARAWAKSEEWTKDGGQFAPGAHIFVKDRRWESLPCVPKVAGVGFAPSRSRRQPEPDDGLEGSEAVEFLKSLESAETQTPGDDDEPLK